jgi:hypothetical protein
MGLPFLLVAQHYQEENPSEGHWGALQITESGLINRWMAGKILPSCLALSVEIYPVLPQVRRGLKSYNLLIFLHKLVLFDTLGGTLQHHQSLWRGPKQRVLKHVRVGSGSGPWRALE